MGKLTGDELAEKLSSIFLTPGNAGIGARRLMEKLREGGDTASPVEVRAWLDDNPTSGPLHSAPPEASYARVREYDVLQPNAVHEADVLYLPTDPGTKDKYALTITDLASRFRWAVPLKGKTSEAVARALEKTYDSGGPLKWPKELKTDAGTEFHGVTTNLLAAHNVKVRRGLRADHRHQSMIESWNGRLAQRIFAAQTLEEQRTGFINRDWVENLPAILRAVNNEKSRLTGLTPAEAITRDLVLPLKDEPVVPLEKQDDVLPVGARVRVLQREPDEGGRYRATDPRFSRKIFTVSDWKAPGPNSAIIYQVKDFDKGRWFTRPQLLPVSLLAKDSIVPKEKPEEVQAEPQADPGVAKGHLSVRPEQAAAAADADDAAASAVPQPRGDEADEAEEENETVGTYQIEKIIRPTGQNSRAGYVVRWKGYKAADDTAEPRAQLLRDVPDMVRAFEEKHAVIWKGAKFSWKK